MTHETPQSMQEPQTPDLLCMPVGERYRALGIADRAVREAGIMLHEQTTSMQIVFDGTYDAHEVISTARQEIVTALEQYTTDMAT